MEITLDFSSYGIYLWVDGDARAFLSYDEVSSLNGSKLIDRILEKVQDDTSQRHYKKSA